MRTAFYASRNCHRKLGSKTASRHGGHNCLPLSITNVLVFFLRRSGVMGKLTSGRIEWDGSAGLKVYSGPMAEINDYISGDNLRSWCILGADGNPKPGWQQIENDGDRHAILGKCERNADSSIISR
jgi:hypothetical protein